MVKFTVHPGNAYLIVLLSLRARVKPRRGNPVEPRMLSQGQKLLTQRSLSQAAPPFDRLIWLTGSLKRVCQRS